MVETIRNEVVKRLVVEDDKGGTLTVLHMGSRVALTMQDEDHAVTLNLSADGFSFLLDEAAGLAEPAARKAPTPRVKASPHEPAQRSLLPESIDELTRTLKPRAPHKAAKKTVTKKPSNRKGGATVHWTDEDDLRLAEGVAKGQSNKAIGDAIGRTAKSIDQRKRKPKVQELIAHASAAE